MIFPESMSGAVKGTSLGGWGGEENKIRTPIVGNQRETVKNVFYRGRWDRQTMMILLPIIKWLTATFMYTIVLLCTPLD